MNQIRTPFFLGTVDQILEENYMPDLRKYFLLERVYIH